MAAPSQGPPGGCTQVFQACSIAMALAAFIVLGLFSLAFYWPKNANDPSIPTTKPIARSSPATDYSGLTRKEKDKILEANRKKLEAEIAEIRKITGEPEPIAPPNGSEGYGAKRSRFKYGDKVRLSTSDGKGACLPSSEWYDRLKIVLRDDKKDELDRMLKYEQAAKFDDGETFEVFAVVGDGVLDVRSGGDKGRLAFRIWRVEEYLLRTD